MICKECTGLNECTKCNIGYRIGLEGSQDEGKCLTCSDGNCETCDR